MSFEPTYEELKHTIRTCERRPFASFEPTYEELKRQKKIAEKVGVTEVLSLPMRN